MHMAKHEGLLFEAFGCIHLGKSLPLKPFPFVKTNLGICGRGL